MARGFAAPLGVAVAFGAGVADRAAAVEAAVVAVDFGAVAFFAAALGLGLRRGLRLGGRLGLGGAAGSAAAGAFGSGVADSAAADAASVVAVVLGAGTVRADADRPAAMRAGRCAERLPITPGASRLGFVDFFLGFSAIDFESTISTHVRRRHRRLTTK